MDPSFSLGNLGLQPYCAVLEINGKQITQVEDVEWERHVLEHKIREVIGGDDVETIKIKQLHHSTLVFNEQIDLLAFF